MPSLACPTMIHLLEQLQHPDETTFASLGGAPVDLKTDDDTTKEAAQAQWDANLQLLQQLQLQTSQLSPLQLSVEGNENGVADDDSHKPPRYFGIVEIQEVPDSTPTTAQEQRITLLQQNLLALLLYLIPDTSTLPVPPCGHAAAAAAPGGCTNHPSSQQPAAHVASPADDASAAATSSSSAAPVLPELVGSTFKGGLHLDSPWTCHQLSAAALNQLLQLVRITPLPVGEGAGVTTAAAAGAGAEVLDSGSSVGHEAVAVKNSRSSSSSSNNNSGGSAPGCVSGPEVLQGGALLSQLLPGLLQSLRPVLLAQHQHDAAQERGEAGAYQGPPVFQRCLAARRLAAAVQLLPPPALTTHLGLLLPLLLAVVDDPSPAVARYGHAGLHWLVATADQQQLVWQCELLVHVAQKMVVGCDVAAWATALPAATRLVLVVESSDITSTPTSAANPPTIRAASSQAEAGNPRSAALDKLLQELLTEVERRGEKAALRHTFLACLAALLPLLRLYVVKHLGRLMPLLLEWLLLGNTPGQAAAAEVLREVCWWGWPRVAAHAGVVWEYVAAAAQVEDAAAAEEQQWQAWRHAGAPEEASGSLQGSRRAGEGDAPSMTPVHQQKVAALVSLVRVLQQAAPDTLRSAAAEWVQQQPDEGGAGGAVASRSGASAVQQLLDVVDGCGPVQHT